jgi:hypothetical protein
MQIERRFLTLELNSNLEDNFPGAELSLGWISVSPIKDGSLPSL